MNILLIDNDIASLNKLTALIQSAGHACTGFMNALEAVEIYEQLHYDVVITDVNMPGMSSIEVLKKVRAINPNAKVILITTVSNADAAIASANNKAYAFLSKPLNFEELARLLEKIAQEMTEERQVANNNAKLLLHYAKLKQAYEELQKLTRRKL